MLASLERKYHGHPKVYVFDIGLNKRYVKELSSIPWVRVVKVPAFVPHWRLCYTWKPYAWNYPEEKYILHLDAGTVIWRPLYLWFLTIKKWGYIAFSQGRKLHEIVPEEYFEKLKIDGRKYGNDEVFAAGIMGFDKSGFAGKAVSESLELVKAGWGIGYSEGERWRIEHPEENIIRKCTIFRHDQTIINLLLRKYAIKPVKVRDERYIPIFRPPRGNKRAFIWSSRINKRSLIHYAFPVGKISFSYAINRIVSGVKIVIKYLLEKRGFKSE